MKVTDYLLDLLIRGKVDYLEEDEYIERYIPADFVITIDKIEDNWIYFRAHYVDKDNGKIAELGSHKVGLYGEIRLNNFRLKTALPLRITSPPI